MILFFLICSVSGFGQKQLSLEKKLEAYDAYIRQGMTDWKIPGLAVAVVKNNQVIFAKSYGVRTYGASTPTDNHTQFSIGSTTKAMTAVCMGMLVDEGKVRWDDPVVQHLPELKLYNPYTTASLRIRDLFTHNSGTGNTDFLWGNMSLTSKEIVKKMADIEPVYPLRGGFIYQNIFYLIAGEVIEKISGKPWSAFIQDRIIKPLELKHTVPLLASSDKSNISSAHYLIEGKTEVIQRLSADNVGPAGSVYACIEDMARWAQVMLDSSKFGNVRLLKSETWKEMFKPQVVVPETQFYPTMKLVQPSWTTYGLGWFQHDYKGRKVNYHTGSLPGEIAMHAQLPSEQLGFYFLGNMDHAELRHALVYKAFDLFALGGDRDWNKEILSLYSTLQANQEEAIASMFSNKIPDTKPSQTLKNYAGIFSNSLHGTITIVESGGALSFDQNDVVKGNTQHFHFDTFSIQYPERWMGKGLVTFHLNQHGSIGSLKVADVEFKRTK